MKLSAADAEKFWKRVDRSGGSKACWDWVGYIRKKDGYGAMSFGRARGQLLAHRVSFELNKGRIRGRLCVCHHCDRPPCVNPEHLFLGTRVDNCDDKVRKQRQCYGEKCHWSTVTEKQVVAIREAHAHGHNTAYIKKKYGLSPTHLRFLLRGKCWRYAGGPRTKTLPQYGETHSQAKLTWEKVREIRRLAQERSMTYEEIGRKFGVKQGCINKVVNRKTWTKGEPKTPPSEKFS